MTLTAVNGCDEEVRARLAGTPPFDLYLTDASGVTVWAYHGDAHLDDIRREDIASGEAITLSTDWTGEDHETGVVVPDGAYLLHGTLRLLKADSVRDIGTLETPPQPLTVLLGTTATIR